MLRVQEMSLPEVTEAGTAEPATQVLVLSPHYTHHRAWPSDKHVLLSKLSQMICETNPDFCGFFFLLELVSTLAPIGRFLGHGASAV